MAKFRAYLQLSELNGPDSGAVRQAVEESLGKAGLANWRVLSVESDEVLPPPPPAPAKPPVAPRRNVQPANVGGYLLAGAVAWALWFFWTMLQE